MAGLFALVAMPFRALKKKQDRDKMDSYVNGVYFETVAPADQLHRALSEHFRRGDFHPMNRVVVQQDQPGRYLVGFAWSRDVRFELEGGSEASGSGEPVVVAEVTYQPEGARIVGRMRPTRFSAHRDWTDEAVMESALPWCFEPIATLDPNARLHKQPPVAAPQLRTSAGLVGQPVDPAVAAPRISAPAAGSMPGGGRFNPPPGWPVSAGWTPPQAWQPDPAWPPAPPGWRV